MAKKVQRVIQNAKDKTVTVYGSISKLDNGDKELVQLLLASGYEINIKPLPQSDTQKANARKTRCREYYVGGTHKNKDGTTTEYKSALTTDDDVNRFNEGCEVSYMYATVWANLKLDKGKKTEFEALEKDINEYGWATAFKRRRDAKKIK